MRECECCGIRTAAYRELNGYCTVCFNYGCDEGYGAVCPEVDLLTVWDTEDTIEERHARNGR